MPSTFRLTGPGGRVLVAQVEDGADRAARAVTIEGVEGTFQVSEQPDGHWRVVHEREESAEPTVACGVRTTRGAWTGIEATAHEWTIEANSSRARHRAAHNDGLRAPMSATVVKVHVGVGDQVEEGAALVVVEAMKMEMPIRAPKAGVVKSVHCQEGDLVQPDLVLVELADPADATGPTDNEVPS